MEAGVGKSRMASMYFGRGAMTESEIRNPAKSTVLRAKQNLSGLSTIPACPTRRRNSMVLNQCVLRSVS